MPGNQEPQIPWRGSIVLLRATPPHRRAGGCRGTSGRFAGPKTSPGSGLPIRPSRPREERVQKVCIKPSRLLGSVCRGGPRVAVIDEQKGSRATTSGSRQESDREIMTQTNRPTSPDEPTLNRKAADWSPAAHQVGGVVGGGARGVERLAEYSRLRKECPVAWANDWGGYWAMTRYADVREAALQHEDFRSGQLFVQVDQPEPVIPISLNPPDHAIYRRALNKYFTRDRIKNLEPTVRQQVIEHLAAALERGEGEMVEEFCAPVAARALASLLNMPSDAWRDLLGQSEQLKQMDLDGMSDEEIGAQSFAMLAARVQQLVEERRQNPLDGESDLISGILTIRVDGEPLPPETVVGIGVMLFGAGHGTTRDGLAASIYRLATSPGDQVLLRSNPALIPAAVEEFLRLEPPVPEAGRRAARDIQSHGRTIGEGDFVALNVAAANLDEAEFEHPSACIIDREPNRHLSFGHGVHKCLGAPLARMEIRVALEEILARTRSFDLADAAEPGVQVFLGGFARLPVRFDLR